MKRSMKRFLLFAAIAAIAIAAPARFAAGPDAQETADGDASFAMDVYLDISCPSCRELVQQTLPGIADGAGVELSMKLFDIMDAAVMDELVRRVSRHGTTLETFPVAFVTTDGSDDAVVFQGFDEIEDGFELLVAGTAPAVSTEGAGGIATTFSVGAIVGAGLMDGINPCAFSTMLFLVSMLALVGRSRREILAIGSIYTATVLLGYFAAGLGLFASVRALMVFPTIVEAVRWLLVAMLVVLATLSVRDGLLARAGRTREMALQLPDRMKLRVHAVVRNGTRSASLVGGTIVLGIGVTVFEFSCTGQVYVPVIMHLARSGSADAVGLLVLYNVAFIVPLLVVFALAYAGVSMKRLGTLFERNVATVKFGLAAVFALLAVMTVLT